MNFSQFLSIYGDQILSILTGVLTATGITAYLGSKLQAWLDKNERRKKVNEVIEACVGLAERQCPALSGPDKFSFAAAKAAEWLSTLGIEISEAELEIAIEKACNAFSNCVKKETAEELTEKILCSNEAKEELENCKGEDGDE